MRNLKNLLVALALTAGAVASAQNVNGNTMPFFKVPPPNWFGRFNDWIDQNEYTVTTNWVFTITGTTPTAVVTAAKGGSLVLTLSGTINDKGSLTEKTSACRPAAGDSWGFTTRFTTDAKVANETWFQGFQDSSTNANSLTTTTGYIASGVGLYCTAGTLSLWTCKSGSATADMTTYSLGTIANSTSYTYTVICRCDPGTSGAGTVKVYRTASSGAGSLGNQLILSKSQTVDIPNGVALYETFGMLALSTDSPVITSDFIGWAANR